MIGLIICHRGLAFELVNTVDAIIGHHTELYPFSNEKISPEQLLKELENFVQYKGNPREVVVMVDLLGGSCWTAARMLCRNHPTYRLLSGVNLPMLFSFLTKKDILPYDEFVQILEKDARRGIASAP